MPQGSSSTGGEAPRYVLTNRWRVRIQAACMQRPTTPEEFAKRAKITVNRARHYFRKLREAGYLRVSHTEQARALRRHYYVATRKAELSDAEFALLTPEEQTEFSRGAVLDFVERVDKAFKAETFDARSDSHFTWIPFNLDEPGWADLMNELMRVYNRALEIQKEAKGRLSKSKGKPIHTTFALAGFESPPEKPGPVGPPV